jgi:hypothetical protein
MSTPTPVLVAPLSVKVSAAVASVMLTAPTGAVGLPEILISPTEKAPSIEVKESPVAVAALVHSAMSPVPGAVPETHRDPELSGVPELGAMLFLIWVSWAWAESAPANRIKLAARAKAGIHAEFIREWFCGVEL